LSIGAIRLKELIKRAWRSSKATSIRTLEQEQEEIRQLFEDVDELDMMYMDIGGEAGE
jgi:predicted DNA-binding transcriptional regulator YafY